MTSSALKKLLALTTLAITPLLAQPAQAHDWQGFYAGINLGYGTGDGETDVSPLPTAAAFVNLAPTTVEADPAGAFGGLQAGYTFANAGSWVFGLEADVQVSDISGDETVAPIIQNNGTPLPSDGFIHTAVDIDWFATVRARLGFEVSPNLVIYGTAGAAFADVNYEGNTDFRPFGTVFYATSVSETETGWTAGGGFDWRLGGGPWSMRAEYMYLDLGDESAVADPSTPLPPFQVGYDWETTAHTVRIGLNYAFGS